MKAWTCHGRSQRDLVNKLVQANIVQTPIVRQVVESVDRRHFIMSSQQDDPYQDSPQFIGSRSQATNRRQTISAPHMHAHVLEEFAPVLLKRQQQRQQQQSNENDDSIRILDVGCGSGYLMACFGEWVRRMASSSTTNGMGDDQVFGIDIRPELVEFTKQNIAKHKQQQQEDRIIVQENTDGVFRVELRDGWKGWPEEGPFDVIHVGAAAEKLPIPLCQQLKVGGMMIVPIGKVDTVQALYKIERVADHRSAATSSKEETSSSTVMIEGDVSLALQPGDFAITKLLAVNYVPLIQSSDEM